MPTITGKRLSPIYNTVVFIHLLELRPVIHILAHVCRKRTIYGDYCGRVRKLKQNLIYGILSIYEGVIARVHHNFGVAGTALSWNYHKPDGIRLVPGIRIQLICRYVLFIRR